MNFLPIAINIEDEQILIIGGGKVAWHKVELLSRYTSNFKVIATYFDPRVASFPGIELVQREYQKSDLQGHLIVYAATDNSELNHQIKLDGRDYRAIVNVVDVPSRCDFVSPAIYKTENMSVAVTSNGKDVYGSIAMRDKIKSFLESSCFQNEDAPCQQKYKESPKTTLYKK